VLKYFELLSIITLVLSPFEWDIGPSL
jgi:hypothetical protein